MTNIIRTIITTFVFIFLATAVSALYPGESLVINSGLDNISNYSISGNTTTVLMTQINDTDINITLATDAVPETLRFTFNGWTHDHPAETQVIYGGGGSSRDRYNASYWINYWNNQTTPINNTNPIILGNDSDSHGCKASAGYSWCVDKNKCIRIWEENCTATVDEVDISNLNWFQRFWNWLMSLFGIN